MHKKGFVYLVGAGCGSADLITVRGLRLLQSCDAVVYDDLIDPALLAQAAHAEQHPAGKRCGRHSMPQSEINSLLVRLGQSGKTVVRLKGGDPFVFGRGGEEFLALQAAGVPCEEVPGISSCIAVPAAAGIPVTHRGASRSFHVITGHTAQTGDTLPESLEALAQRGITADLCPEQATGAELARALCAAAGPGEEILLFRAAESSPEMRGILTAQGFSVREYTLYKTEYAAASPNAEADYLAFASAGGVRAWFSACGAAPKGAVCVCIGPVTARALAQQTGAPFLTAEDISAEGVAECILRAHRHKKAQEE